MGEWAWVIQVSKVKSLIPGSAKKVTSAVAGKRTP